VKEKQEDSEEALENFAHRNLDSSLFD